MPAYLDELYKHQEWADAEHWRALEAHAPALADQAIRARLHHIHLVQSAFLWILGSRGEQFVVSKVEDYPNMSDLKAFARKGHAGLAALLRGADESFLDEAIEVPWFQPLLRLARRHALMQAAMHSHYHRGQNATRLRELGGAPPATDFIVWMKDGQPAARWT